MTELWKVFQNQNFRSEIKIYISVESYDEKTAENNQIYMLRKSP